MRLLLAALVLGLAVTFGGAQAATAPADPIVGVWSYGGGTVSVRETATGFEGIVGRPIRFTECVHYAGERMWSIVKTANGYAGRQFSFGAGIGCRGRIWVSANWKLQAGKLRFWVATRSSVWPQRCGLETLCFSLARRSTAPAPGTAQAPRAVSFRFNVEGKAVSKTGFGSAYESTVAEGRGSVSATGTATGSAVVFHVQTTGEGELIEVDVTGARARTASRLVLGLAVRESSVAGCGAGSRGTLTLVNGAVDEVVIAACGRSSRHREGVRVSFGAR